MQLQGDLVKERERKKNERERERETDFRSADQFSPDFEYFM